MLLQFPVTGENLAEAAGAFLNLSEKDVVLTKPSACFKVPAPAPLWQISQPPFVDIPGRAQ
jgi:hypothetical protein